MLIDMTRYENIRTIQKMLNIDETLAGKIYDEAGVDIDKIYNSFKTIKLKPVGQKKYTRCLRCGRPLKTAESRICGYGAICKDKVSMKKKSKKRNFIGAYYGINTSTEGNGK